MSKNLSAIEVRRVHEDDPVNGVHVTNMVDKISSAKVHGDFSIGRTLFKHPENPSLVQDPSIDDHDPYRVPCFFDMMTGAPPGREPILTS